MVILQGWVFLMSEVPLYPLFLALHLNVDYAIQNLGLGI